MLLVRNVNLRSRRLLQVLLPYSCDYAHDGQVVLIGNQVVAEADLLADWVLAGKELARQRLTDDAGERSSRDIMVVEIAPFPNWDSRNVKVIRTDGHEQRRLRDVIPRRRIGMTCDPEASVTICGLRRQCSGCCDLFDSWHCASVLQQCGIERGGVLRISITVGRVHGMHHRELVHSVSRIDGVQRNQAADENARSHEQSHREGDFSDHDPGAQLSTSATSNRISLASVKRAAQIATAGLERRREPEYERAEQ